MAGAYNNDLGLYLTKAQDKFCPSIAGLPIVESSGKILQAIHNRTAQQKKLVENLGAKQWHVDFSYWIP